MTENCDSTTGVTVDPILPSCLAAQLYLRILKKGYGLHWHPMYHD